MGRDKARLTGRTDRELWQERLEVLEGLGTGQVLISCRADQDYFVSSGKTCIIDQWPEAGPLGGIVSCLQAMEGDHLLVMAVDLPAMTGQPLGLLLEAAAGASGATGRGAVFRLRNYLEPLVAVYPASMAESGRRRLAAGEGSLRQWIHEAADLITIVDVPPEWEVLFANVNDASAWDQWLSGG